VVRYRVAWEFKEGIQNPPDPTTKELMQTKMNEYLRKNGGYLYTYKIHSPSVNSARNFVQQIFAYFRK
jgi:hypothetical protein